MQNQAADLLSELKTLWGINTQELDQQALALIKDYLEAKGMSQEEFEIQLKVLARTRAKTESLLKRLDDIEGKL